MVRLPSEKCPPCCRRAQVKDDEWTATPVDIEFCGYYLNYFSRAKDWNESSRNWQFPETAKILAHDLF